MDDAFLNILPITINVTEEHVRWSKEVQCLPLEMHCNGIQGTISDKTQASISLLATGVENC